MRRLKQRWEPSSEIHSKEKMISTERDTLPFKETTPQNLMQKYALLCTIKVSYDGYEISHFVTEQAKANAVKGAISLENEKLGRP